MGTALIVLGGATVASERVRPADFRGRGVAFALVCAALFATRDNIVRSVHSHAPPPLIAATALLVAAAIALFGYAAVVKRDRVVTSLHSAVPAFVPAGLALAVGYDALLAALSHGRVSIVSPLNAPPAPCGQSSSQHRCSATTTVLDGGLSSRRV